jgi:hypothetical protein
LNVWLAGLEARYLANLRLPEVARALRALSSAYVERRHVVRSGQAYATAGKRAAFSLFYAPLHFMTVQRIVRALGADTLRSTTILDLGCGNGAAGAAWATACRTPAPVVGIDRHPAAVDEARWTYRRLGLDGTARREDIVPHPEVPRSPRHDGARPSWTIPGRLMRGRVAIVAAYALNELPDDAREHVWALLCHAAQSGSHVLVIEPIAKSLTPWWAQTAAHARRLGGRADEWRFPVLLPDLVARLDRAAGLRHGELTARSIYLAPE